MKSSTKKAAPKKEELIKFMPSYVGSKAYWVDKLQGYKGKDIVEVFSGSAVLSANLAGTAVLNDFDPIIYKIFSNYDKLQIKEAFSDVDYYKVRSQEDWWKWVYCLQKMSFSGVFRYSKNGFNVPMKENFKGKSINVKEEFKKAQKRFKELSPEVFNKSFLDLPMDLFVGKVVILDPPYEGSKTAYNKVLDYDAYWKFVKKVSKVASAVLIFDTKSNIEKAGYEVVGTRKMRVNGSRPGDVEALAIIGENLYQKES